MPARIRFETEFGSQQLTHSSEFAAPKSPRHARWGSTNLPNSGAQARAPHDPGRGRAKKDSAALGLPWSAMYMWSTGPKTNATGWLSSVLPIRVTLRSRALEVFLDPPQNALE